MREPELEGCHRTALIASEGRAYRQLVKGSQALIFWFFCVKTKEHLLKSQLVEPACRLGRDSKLLIPAGRQILVLFHQVWYIPTASVGGTPDVSGGKEH
jgi:hypothetical protein